VHHAVLAKQLDQSNAATWSQSLCSIPTNTTFFAFGLILKASYSWAKIALAAHTNVVCTGPVLGQCGTNSPDCSFWVDRFKGF
jgi:hypothetical protein